MAVVGVLNRRLQADSRTKWL